MGLFESDTRNKIDEETADDEETQDEASKVDSEEEDKEPPAWDDSTSWVAFVKSLFIYFLLTMWPIY